MIHILNTQVESIEYDSHRVTICNTIKNTLKTNNINFHKGTIESTKFESNSFDAIFCYGVIFLVDYKKALKEFYRLLKPGGTLYFNANGIGWTLTNLLESINATDDFNPFNAAIESIKHTINYFNNDTMNESIKYKSLILPSDLMKKTLCELGYNNITIKAEGHINLTNTPIKSFFEPIQYKHENIYECLCKTDK